MKTPDPSSFPPGRRPGVPRRPARLAFAGAAAVFFAQMAVLRAADAPPAAIHRRDGRRLQRVHRGQGRVTVLPLLRHRRSAPGQRRFCPTRPHDGTFAQYHSDDRSSANLRKNHGFNLVATGPDRIAEGPADAFQTVRIHKRRGAVSVLVDDGIVIAWEDDGVTHGPGLAHSGWIGFRPGCRLHACPGESGVRQRDGKFRHG